MSVSTRTPGGAAPQALAKGPPKPDLSWFCCICCARRPIPHASFSFLLTTCSHIVCSSCWKRRGNGECPKCGVKANTLNLSTTSKLPKQLEPYYKNPIDLIKQLLAVCEFQEQQKRQRLETRRVAWVLINRQRAQEDYEREYAECKQLMKTLNERKREVQILADGLRKRGIDPRKVISGGASAGSAGTSGSVQPSPRFSAPPTPFMQTPLAGHLPSTSTPAFPGVNSPSVEFVEPKKLPHTMRGSVTSKAVRRSPNVPPTSILTPRFAGDSLNRGNVLPAKRQRVTTPVFTPVASHSQQYTMSQQSARPVMQPSQPIMQSARPVMQPGQPIMQSARPVMQPGQPMMQPGRPVIQPGRPVMQPGQPVLQAGQQPVQSRGQPVLQFGQPMVQPGQPGGQFTPPVVQFGRPVMHSTQHVGQSGRPMGQSTQHMGQSGPPMMQYRQSTRQASEPMEHSGQQAGQRMRQSSQPVTPSGQSTRRAGQPIRQPGQQQQPVGHVDSFRIRAVPPSSSRQRIFPSPHSAQTMQPSRTVPQPSTISPANRHQLPGPSSTAAFPRAPPSGRITLKPSATTPAPRSASSHTLQPSPLRPPSTKPSPLLRAYSTTPHTLSSRQPVHTPPGMRLSAGGRGTGSGPRLTPMKS